ncbi:MAG: geranylgeranyl reductase family protein [Bacteroidia bacterium]
MEIFDIAIIGAGPAGAACALGLRGSMLRVALIDKANFPRDKVCGDAIPARAMRVLRELAPEAAVRLNDLPMKEEMLACTVVSPGGKRFTYEFAVRGYCMRRMDFDAFLVDEAAKVPEVELMQGMAVKGLVREDGIWRIEADKGEIQARMVIGCDGANGITSKLLGGFALDPRHHCAAVRQYYDGVADLDPQVMEIHLLQDRLPGYLWIFPVGGGACNVGFGMLSADIAKRKLSLRSELGDIVAGSAGLRERFAGARALDKVQGFGLPLGSRWVTMSGEGFLLCGDAASLIDPATGEGIGNAMWSGQIAARCAWGASMRREYSAASLIGYSEELKAKLYPEMRRKYWVQRLAAGRPWLLDFLIGRASRGGIVGRLARKWF